MISHWSIQAIFLAVIGYYTWKKLNAWTAFHLTMLSVSAVIFVGYYYMFPKNIPEYYLHGVTTLLLLYSAGVMATLAQKHRALQISVFLLLASVSYQNITKLNREYWSHPNLTTLHHKDAIVREILNRHPVDEPFYISYIYEPGWNSGFAYLFKLYGRESQGLAHDKPVYTIVIPKDRAADSIDVYSGNVGLILPD